MELQIIFSEWKKHNIFNSRSCCLCTVELSFQISLYVDDCFVLYLYFWRQGPVEHFTGKIRYLLVVFSLSVRARKKNRDTVKTWIGSVFKLQVDDISFAAGWREIKLCRRFCRYWSLIWKQVLILFCRGICFVAFETGSLLIGHQLVLLIWFGFIFVHCIFISLCFCCFVKTYY